MYSGLGLRDVSTSSQAVSYLRAQTVKAHPLLLLAAAARLLLPGCAPRPRFGIKPGRALLQDAVHRAVAVSQNVGVRELLVHALHDRAKAFHEHYGFQASTLHPMTLMLRLHTLKS